MCLSRRLLVQCICKMPMPYSSSLCAEASEAVKGADVLTVVTLSFLEAALGKKHSLQVAPLPCRYNLPAWTNPLCMDL